MVRGPTVMMNHYYSVEPTRVSVTIRVYWESTLSKVNISPTKRPSGDHFRSRESESETRSLLNTECEMSPT